MGGDQRPGQKALRSCGELGIARSAEHDRVTHREPFQKEVRRLGHRHASAALGLFPDKEDDLFFVVERDDGHRMSCELLLSLEQIADNAPQVLEPIGSEPTEVE